MKELNILIITHTTSLYGANKSMLNLISGLCDQVNFIVILPREGEVCLALENLNIKYYVINFGLNSAIIDRKFLNYIKFIPRFVFSKYINNKAKLKIKSIIDENKINIIHSNSTTISIGYEIAKKNKIRHIWHIREFQDVGCNLYPFLGMNNLRKEIQNSDKIISISKSLSEYYKVSQKAQIVYNGVTKLTKTSISDTNKEDYFMFCGSIDENKGILEAIEVFSKVIDKFNNIKLLIVGNVSSRKYKEFLDKRIKRLNLIEKVIFLGYRTDVNLLMQKSKGLLMCSRFEGMGRVTVEAMIFNCLVIGYNSTGTKELICHKKTGLLYETEKDLYEMMTLALSDNPLINSIIQRARSYAIEKFSEEAYSKNIYSIYISMLDNNSEIIIK